MELTDSLARLDKQEKSLALEVFDAETAWKLGLFLREQAVARQAPIAVEIRHGSKLAFYFSAEGATPDNADWLRRKLAVVSRFERSSLYFATMLKMKGTTLLERYGLPVADFAASGGAVPIHVRNAGIVGAVAVSGLKQEEDHQLVCDALAAISKT